jgi:linoleoyl-CoA desaturase
MLILTGVVTQAWWMLALCIVMGIAVGGIGLSVMHDANHGAYSSKPWVNNLLGLSLNIVGGNAFNWKVQHNVLHHTYTNIHDVDEDISPRGVLRLCPHGEWKPFHRFQHFYAWFFYGLMTLVWVIVKDYVRIVKYEKDGLVRKQKASIRNPNRVDCAVVVENPLCGVYLCHSCIGTLGDMVAITYRISCHALRRRIYSRDHLPAGTRD